MCVNFLLHVHYTRIRLPLFIDVVCTRVHCLPAKFDYDNNVVIVGILDSILVPDVSVPFTELHKHACLYCSCFGTNMHCSPTNDGHFVVRFLTFYCCTEYCLYQSFH